jgi:hypothetical protein
MKKKNDDNSALSAFDHRALSRGERVARDGVFTGRRGSGEGYLPDHGVRSSVVALLDGTNPSPVALRLAKAPEVDTVSPRERAWSRAWGALRIRWNEAGMSMKTKNDDNPVPRGEGWWFRLSAHKVQPFGSKELSGLRKRVECARNFKIVGTDWHIYCIQRT